MQDESGTGQQKARKLSKTTEVISKELGSQLDEAPARQTKDKIPTMN